MILTTHSTVKAQAVANHSQRLRMFYASCSKQLCFSQFQAVVLVRSGVLALERFCDDPFS